MTSADWVAASTRARAMARGRVGAGACRTAAATGEWSAALRVLAPTAAGPRLARCRTLAEADLAGRAALVWSVRVLAGWIPARGTGVVRALAAGAEVANLTAMAARLAGGQAHVAVQDGDVPLDLGALATAWPRLSGATSVAQLREALRRSPWGDPGSPEELPDVLTAVWLRRLVAEVPATRAWARCAAALLVARRSLLDQPPVPRLVAVLGPVLGRSWSAAHTPDALRSALSPAVARCLEGVTAADDLWRAEARLRGQVQADGFGLLRRGVPGPDVVVGAVAVLAVDSWRVTAALAAAAAGGASEVLDVVA
ncbi:hypothetical protein Q6348_07125 [Isoptericola sp. b441]|uniref:Uncharacterized protein n=1 Tax=Actinotalea lenta TaxID=3064654 RepID=A0ABT9D7X2_9CELL|nr:hypothetical protein [Isoptericola sp. b441]MDO8106968.1 hypothetical protein [Isoptericola sp. b441]